MKKLTTFLKLFGGLAAVIALTFAVVNLSKASANDDVKLCHLTSSQTNPWVVQTVDANQVASHEANGDFPYSGTCTGNGNTLNSCQNTWCNNNQPGDVCPNIAGKQSSVPQGDILSNGQCIPAPITHNSCNPDLHTCIQVAGPGQSTCLTNADCQPHHLACSNNMCVVVNTAGSNTCSEDKDCQPKVSPTPTCDSDRDDEDEDIDNDDNCVTPTVTPTATPTPTVTPTPTQTPSNPGGPGDGRSDGRSDGGSSCPSCTQAPQTQVLGASTGPTQAVLGASTMAGTGTFENTLMEVMMIAGTIVLGAGLKSYAKEKKN